MANSRPKSREKNVTESSKGVKKRGSGLGSGSVGNRETASKQSKSQSSGNTVRESGGKKSPLWKILILVVALLGGGGGAAGMFGGLFGNDTLENSSNTGANNGGTVIGELLDNMTGGTTETGSLSELGSTLSGLGSLLNSGTTSNGWELNSNTGKLNTSVASTAREKRTEILGDNQDSVTIMVYMCGTDLESRYGMGTSDLQEMLAADLGDKVNLIVYTGGCSEWKNTTISNTVNQIYQVKNGKLYLLVEDAGTVAMTNPETLTGFIQWCNKNFPANRNQLIFWDHGGGSISGYGYDEKFSRSGSMDLAEINQALKEAGVMFDYIGFDACLMATLETALMLTPYADYLIASEETEPGVGWYYTNWLNRLAKNTSMPTIEIGKNIVDDFVDTCASQCKGQKTTLSVVDLAELEMTVPEELKAFSKSASALIQGKEYKTVSDARYKTREFAQSSAIDQVDLTHLAKNLGTKEGEALAQALLSAVKYNRTSDNMTNAYGLSIYFPYKKVSSVDQVVDTYEAIGMDTEYARCIQEFASLEVAGQTAAGGTASPLPSLLGTLLGGSVSENSAGSEVIAELLGGFLSGQFGNISGLDKSNTNFYSEYAMDTESMASYLSNHYFDASALVWEENSQGQNILKLSAEQWNLVHSLELNMFYDDGEGYVDLGFDTVFKFDENGYLIGDTDRTWLAINGQPVAYYYQDTVEEGEHYTITGYVPALLNGERVNLLLVFDNENPEGYIAGAYTVYMENETETVAKSMSGLQEGDTLDFLCDYYSYDGSYQDSYYLGEQMTVTETMTISNVEVGEGAVRVTYRFTDIYNQQYWTPAFAQ